MTVDVLIGPLGSGLAQLISRSVVIASRRIGHACVIRKFVGVIDRHRDALVGEAVHHRSNGVRRLIGLHENNVTACGDEGLQRGDHRVGGQFFLKQLVAFFLSEGTQPVPGVDENRIGVPRHYADADLQGFLSSGNARSHRQQQQHSKQQGQHFLHSGLSLSLFVRISAYDFAPLFCKSDLYI